jgi:hypothetical protein
MNIDIDEYSQFAEDDVLSLEADEILCARINLDARRRLEHRNELLRLRELMYDPLFDMDLSNEITSQ